MTTRRPADRSTGWRCRRAGLESDEVVREAAYGYQPDELLQR
ncbi:hypothetical protein [Frankia sp. QA3]|nr:hypothetical protein [Frankia sp. QA3]